MKGRTIKRTPYTKTNIVPNKNLLFNEQTKFESKIIYM